MATLRISGAAFVVVAAAASASAASYFTLSSPAFTDNGVLPLKYAGADCRGRKGGNTSPPLVWSDPPGGTRSFAVLMIDPDGGRGLGSVHWVAYGIPASQTELKEGEGNAGAAQDIVDGKNSRGTLGYTGPCGPSIDAPHHYTVDVIALDLAPGALPPGLDREQLLKAIVGHALGPASLVVRYHNEP